MSQEYKSNSHKSKENEEKKKVDKVVQGKVKAKKKSGVTKFADVFISEDASNVKNYIVMEVLIPAMKKALSDIVTNGIDMILYGETGVSKKRSSASRISYTNYYDRRDERSSRLTSIRGGYSYDDIILDNRGEAEDVLARMDELIDTYGIVSVADLYDLVGITGNYTDNKYGWTDIRSAQVVRVRDGYMIKLPRAIPLN
ncbi:MAG: hypothetical protein ACI4XM_01345 [Candidatus Coprovivens sp.]